MFNLDVDGETWRYAFAQPDSCLSWDDREHLLRETVRLYKKGNKNTKVKGEDYEGKIKRGEFRTFGICAGRFYNAELETSKGKRYASILVQKTMDSSLN